MRQTYVYLALGLASAFCAPAASAQSAGLDRTVLPIAQPERPLYDELDARNAKAPPPFEIKAPAGAPNVVIVLIDDLGFGATGTFGGPIPTPTMEKLAQGVHVGTGFVGGIECEHLAFRNPRVDWQIWISKGERPLPMKYVITTKWVTGAPQFTLRLANWNVAPQFAASEFTFAAPPDARKLEGLQADAIGEATLEEGQQ